MTVRIFGPARPVTFPSFSGGSGQHFYASSAIGNGTSNTLGNGSLRLGAWYCPVPLTISAIGAEITTIGDVGSKLRLGVYSDLNGMPDQPLIDATIAGDSATVQMTTLGANVTLPAGWLWTGGAVQVVTTTQPTIRTVSSAATHIFPLFLGTSTPAANVNTAGYLKGSVTGALPTFGTTVSTSSTVPRVILKIA